MELNINTLWIGFISDRCSGNEPAVFNLKYNSKLHYIEQINPMNLRKPPPPNSHQGGTITAITNTVRKVPAEPAACTKQSYVTAREWFPQTSLLVPNVKKCLNVMKPSDFKPRIRIMTIELRQSQRVVLSKHENCLPHLIPIHDS